MKRSVNAGYTNIMRALLTFQKESGCVKSVRVPLPRKVSVRWVGEGEGARVRAEEGVKEREGAMYIVHENTHVELSLA